MLSRILVPDIPNGKNIVSMLLVLLLYTPIICWFLKRVIFVYDVPAIYCVFAFNVACLLTMLFSVFQIVMVRVYNTLAFPLASATKTLETGRVLSMSPEEACEYFSTIDVEMLEICPLRCVMACIGDSVRVVEHEWGAFCPTHRGTCDEFSFSRYNEHLKKYLNRDVIGLIVSFARCGN